MTFYIDENGDFVGTVKALGEYDPRGYINEQKIRYTTALGNGNQQAALDALWRAASHSNLLPQGEQSIKPEEANHYTRRLGWPEI